MPSHPGVGCWQPLPEHSPRRVGLSPSAWRGRRSGGCRTRTRGGGCAGPWGLRGPGEVGTAGTVSGLGCPSGNGPGGTGRERALSRPAGAAGGSRSPAEPPSGAPEPRSPGAPAGESPVPAAPPPKLRCRPRGPARPVLPRHCVEPDAPSSLSSPSPPPLIPPALPPPLPLIDVSAEMCPVPRISLISLREEGGYRRN